MVRQTHTSLRHWLEARTARWQELEQLSRSLKPGADGGVDGVTTLGQGYRSLMRDLALARQIAPQSKVTRYLESLVLRFHDLIFQPVGNVRADIAKLLMHDVPNSFRALQGAFAAVAAWFVLSVVCGWLLVWFAPETVTLFASEKMIEGVQNGRLWTEGMLNVVPSSLASLGIMTNNIVVSLTAFGLGMFYGLGTLYMMTLNGFMLGSLFAYTMRFDMGTKLFEFVVAHGVVELSVVCLAGAAGTALGEALIRPGFTSRMEAFHRAASIAGPLMLVGCLFLIGAGLIEGYISPNPEYPLAFRIAVGLAYGVLFWLVLTGKLWRIVAPRRNALHEVQQI